MRNAAEYRATGHPRSSIGHGTIVNRISMNVGASTYDSTSILHYKTKAAEHFFFEHRPRTHVDSQKRLNTDYGSDDESDFGQQCVTYGPH